MLESFLKFLSGNQSERSGGSAYHPAPLSEPSNPYIPSYTHAKQLYPLIEIQKLRGRLEALESSQPMQVFDDGQGSDLQISVTERLLLPLLAAERSFPPQNAWFNDEIINQVFSSLEKNSDGKIAALSSLYCGSQGLFDQLMDRNQLKSLRARLAVANIIFWPVIEQNHWHLVIIDKSNVPVSVYALDGFNKQNKDIVRKYGFKLVEAMMPEMVCQEGLVMMGSQITVPEQTDPFNCGPVICHWAKRIAEHYLENHQIPDGSKFVDQKLNYTASRKWIAEVYADSLEEERRQAPEIRTTSPETEYSDYCEIVSEVHVTTRRRSSSSRKM